jgi:hypothetical protein
MHILLHVLGWPMILFSVLGFFGTQTVVGQIIAAIVFVAGWICIGAAVIAGALDDIRQGDERQRIREWNLGIATLDQLRHPAVIQTSPTPADEKFREPISAPTPATPAP